MCLDVGVPQRLFLMRDTCTIIINHFSTYFYQNFQSLLMIMRDHFQFLSVLFYLHIMQTEKL